jgi:hypothetical protein
MNEWPAAWPGVFLGEVDDQEGIWGDASVASY